MKSVLFFIIRLQGLDFIIFFNLLFLSCSKGMKERLNMPGKFVIGYQVRVITFYPQVLMKNMSSFDFVA